MEVRMDVLALAVGSAILVILIAAANAWRTASPARHPRARDHSYGGGGDVAWFSSDGGGADAGHDCGSSDGGSSDGGGCDGGGGDGGGGGD